jgi:spermidine/putrescine ABC transporter ATP-binding subunit
MEHLRLQEVSKFYGRVRAVDRLSLSIERAENVALLGPSGCGKTTTLNLIAGFLEPDGGAIRIGDRDVAGLPPNKRNLGMVFQSYALFPHMTVGENVAFGLKLRRVEPAERERRLKEALDMVRLGDFRDRYPRQLSGGQQQRVALARALVVHPDIMLYDEPLSNLDAKLREEMRTELLDIQDRIKITSIYVTHDQEEALALADRVAVMNNGRIEQIGTPDEVYENPATGFVAKFLGESNVLPATVARVNGSAVVLDIGGTSVNSTAKERFSIGDRVEVVVRSERLTVSPDPLSTDNCFKARLHHVIYLGGTIRYLIRLGDHRLIMVEKNRGDRAALPEGSDVYVGWPAKDSLLVRLA